MKRILTILLILLLPLSLFAMSPLSESDLSNVTSTDSLNIAPRENSDSISKLWSLYFNDPSNLDTYLNEDSSETIETLATQNFQGSPYTLTDYTATVSVVGMDDPYNAGMSHIEYRNGLIRATEGPTTVEVWLGGLANTRNAGKMCDFYTDQIKSYTYPNSSTYISTR